MTLNLRRKKSHSSERKATKKFKWAYEWKIKCLFATTSHVKEEKNCRFSLNQNAKFQ